MGALHALQAPGRMSLVACALEAQPSLAARSCSSGEEQRLLRADVVSRERQGMTLFFNCMKCGHRWRDYV